MRLRSGHCGKTVFGDPEDDITRFFDAYFSPECTLVIKPDGKPISAAYILPVGDLTLPDGVPVSCAMLYAIATLPGYPGPRLWRCRYARCGRQGAKQRL